MHLMFMHTFEKNIYLKAFRNDIVVVYRLMQILAIISLFKEEGEKI